MGETSSSEQTFGRFKFVVLQGYQVRDGSRCKKKKITFIVYVKESLSVYSFMF